jgi:hypothetical protein
MFFLGWDQHHNRIKARLFTFSKIGQRTPPEPLYPEQPTLLSPDKRLAADERINAYLYGVSAAQMCLSYP